MAYKVFGTITLAIFGWVAWNIFDLTQSAQAEEIQGFIKC